MVFTPKSLLGIVLLVLLAVYCSGFVTTKPSTSASSDSSNVNLGKAFENNRNNLAYLNSKRYQRSIYGLGPKMLPILHSKIPVEWDLLVDELDDDSDERSKRYDDYGHMRFGKRGGEKFDDYGHMRFGRSA